MIKPIVTSSSTIVAPSQIVKRIEVWHCQDDSDDVVLASEATWGEDSESPSVCLGEQLVTEIRRSRHPKIAHAEDVDQSVRQSMSDFGCNCMIGIPCMSTSSVTSVTVFLLNDGESIQGAFEIWSRDERRELGLDDGVFANLSRFATLSRLVRFPYGAGLPGQVWEARFPKIIPALGSSPIFMRASGARVEGLSVGVGIPMMESEHDLNSTVLLLSAQRSPIARAFEIWVPCPEGETLSRFQAHYDSCLEFNAEIETISANAGSGILGKAWAEQRAQVGRVSDLQQDRAPAANQAGLTHVFATPIFVGNRVRCVLSMMI